MNRENSLINKGIYAEGSLHNAQVFVGSFV